MENMKMNVESLIEGDNSRDASFYTRYATLVKKINELASLYNVPIIVMVYNPENGFTHTTQTPYPNPDPIGMWQPEEVVGRYQNIAMEDGREVMNEEIYLMAKIAMLEKMIKRLEVKNRAAWARYLLSRAHYQGVMEFNEEERATVEWFACRQLKKLMKRKALLQKRKKIRTSSPSDNAAAQNLPPVISKEDGAGQAGDQWLMSTANQNLDLDGPPMNNSFNTSGRPPVDETAPIPKADNAGMPGDGMLLGWNGRGALCVMV